VDVAKTETGYPAVKVPTEKRDAIFNASKMKHIDEKAKQVNSISVYDEYLDYNFC
jgi:hypothetical protein